MEFAISVEGQSTPTAWRFCRIPGYVLIVRGLVSAGGADQRSILSSGERPSLELRLEIQSQIEGEVSHD